MNKTLILLLLGTHTVLFAQQSIPCIRASSRNALIVEGPDEKYAWSLSPETKPDIHKVSKCAGPKWVTFYTDIDSLRIRIKPNQAFDFWVVLNDKDSCLTRIQYLAVQSRARQKPATQDTIPFVLTDYNNLKVRAIINGVDTLFLKFDSGTTGLLLTNEAIAHKLKVAKDTGNVLQIGNLTWTGLPIYPVALSGQGTDGRFGWDLFDGSILEINYDKNIMVVHSKRPNIGKGYSRFTIDYLYSLICIQASLQIGKKVYRNRFLFDNGYQRTIMLDTMLMMKQNYPKDLQVIKKVIMKNGQGKEIPVITVNNERLNLGRHTLFNIPVQLMTTGNPARFETHILGNEVLKRFNTFLDFQHNFIYLKPNALLGLAYTDAH